ncbi:MAG: beta-carotene ketolase [Pseudanabaena sp.]|nr:MAG: beta-carotene ketolase [Pseudanabaena sp.]
MQMFKSPQKAFQSDDWLGLASVVAIFSLWLISLLKLITISALDLPWIWLVLAILGRSYLHTGLFIIAHDSMHNNLIPCDRRLNDLLGNIAVSIYGFLPYAHCRKNHTEHHRFPSQSGDPDFHGSISHPFFWYCKFIREYFPLRSLLTFLVNMSVIFWGLAIFCNISFVNLILFWIVPLILSSLQLFFFGTYLPHRQIYNNPNFSPRLERNAYWILWSFVSCYNFGHYHWEHHEYPKTPWYRLPSRHLHNVPPKMLPAVATECVRT